MAARRVGVRTGDVARRLDGCGAAELGDDGGDDAAEREGIGERDEGEGMREKGGGD